MSDEPDFHLTIEAVRKCDGTNWDIGEALIKEVGIPPKQSVNDNSYVLIEKCAKQLFSLGFPMYTTSTLSTIRRITHAFPAPSRRPGVSFYAHRVAGSPEKLDAILAVINKETDIKPTGDVIQHINRNPEISIKEAVKTYSRDPDKQRHDVANTIREEAEEIAQEISPSTPLVIERGVGVGVGGGSGGGSGNVIQFELYLWMDQALQKLIEVHEALLKQNYTSDTLDAVNEKAVILINKAREIADVCGEGDPKTRFNVVGEKR